MFVIFDERGRVAGLSETEIKSDGLFVVEVEVEEGHPIFENITAFRIANGQLVQDDFQALQTAKQLKMEALSAECQKEIERGFSYLIDGQIYDFSLDIEAQQNFNMTFQMMNENMIDFVQWTARANGEIVRVGIDAKDMRGIMQEIAEIKTAAISKLRDFLAMEVEEAQTVEAVESINW